MGGEAPAGEVASEINALMGNYSDNLMDSGEQFLEGMEPAEESAVEETPAAEEVETKTETEQESADDGLEITIEPVVDDTEIIDEPAVEPVVEAEETPELTDTERITNLQNELASAMEQLNNDAPSTGVADTAAAEDDSVVASVMAKIQEQYDLTPKNAAGVQNQSQPGQVAFVSEETLADAFTPEGMNKFANNIVTVAVDQAMRTSQPIITSEVNRNLLLQRLSDSFYEQNPDLRGKEPVVGAVCKEILGKNASMSASEMFEKAGLIARKRLQMSPVKSVDGKAKVKAAKRKPGFAGAAGGGGAAGTPGKKKSSVADDINELAGLLG